MIRRALAIALLLTLSSQTAASLYACHHNAGPQSRGERRSPAPGVSDLTAIHGVDGGAHHHDDDQAPLRGCNRHHRGACAHEGRGALGTCSGDPVAGLQAASDGAPTAPLTMTIVPPVTEAAAALAGTPPDGRQPSPELPPPRA